MNTIPHEGIIRFRGFFNQENLIVCSPAAAAEVIVTHNDRFEKPAIIRGIAGRILGNGVLLAEGEDHKMQRRKLMPAFSFRRIKEVYPIFWEKAAEDVQILTAQIGGREGYELETHNWFSRCALDIIGTVGLGKDLDFGAVVDENNPLAKTYEDVMKPNRLAAMFAVLRLIFPNWLVNLIPTKRNNVLNEASQQIRGVCRDLVKDKKSRLDKGEQPDPDILSTALQGGGFTEDQTIDQAMTFLAAGHETVASTMAWAMYSLCRNPEAQRKLREEVRERLPSVDSGSGITSGDIESMPYLSAVCSEILRLYPPVPFTIRQPLQDTTIQGLPVPKGTRIVVCAWGTNRCHEYWGPTGDDFIPERWLDDHQQSNKERNGSRNDDDDVAPTPGKGAATLGGSTSLYANLTFLHGPRSCIGQAFARAEFACLLATFIGRFEIEFPEGCEGARAELGGKDGLGVQKGAFTVKPGKDGLVVRVKPLGGF
jgi:cytochrome P450